MKEYTVKEIAALLSVSDETVRRWIRNNKLEADRSAGTQGNKVKEDQLKNFLKNNQRQITLAAAQSLNLMELYEGKVALNGAIMGGTVFGPIGALTGAAGLISILKAKKKSDQTIVTKSQDSADADEIILSMKLEIAQKESELNLLKAQLKIIEETKGDVINDGKE